MSIFVLAELLKKLIINCHKKLILLLKLQHQPKRRYTHAPPTNQSPGGRPRLKKQAVVDQGF